MEQEVLDQVVLQAIHDALSEDLLRVAVDRAGQDPRLDRRTSIERELSLIAAKKEHLVDAIAAGDKDPAIFERLKLEESRRQALMHELEQLAMIVQVSSLDGARLRRELKARLADTDAPEAACLLGQTIAQGASRASVTLRSGE